MLSAARSLEREPWNTRTWKSEADHTTRFNDTSDSASVFENVLLFLVLEATRCFSAPLTFSISSAGADGIRR